MFWWCCFLLPFVVVVAAWFVQCDAGPQDEDPSGDKRLRQDVSQLVAVMFKQKMLTDKQRLFLLAQVGGGSCWLPTDRTRS